MTTFLYFVCAASLSLLAILYLRHIDEKRVRVFRLRRTLTLPRSRLLGWALAILPGLVLIAMGQLSAFLVWFGAITVCSWLIVSQNPDPASQ